MRLFSKSERNEKRRIKGRVCAAAKMLCAALALNSCALLLTSCSGKDELGNRYEERIDGIEVADALVD